MAIEAMDRSPGAGRLLESAQRLFAGRSYVEVGVAEILQGAGVKAPTLYHHYGDKEGLYVAWAEAAFAQLGERVRAVMSASEDSYEALVRLAQAIGTYKGLDLLVVMRDAPRHLRSESTERIVRAYFDAVYEPTCVALLNAADSGVIHLADIGRMASHFLMGALSASRRYALPATNASDDYAGYVKLFVRAHRRED